MNILYWNIQQFGFNKYKNGDIMAVLGEVFFPGLASIAEIIVIVEVMARNEQLGAVPTGSGAVGLEALTQEILEFDSNYICIPPISLATGGGQAEAIGIFYNSDELKFVGPMVWSNFGPVPLTEIGKNRRNAKPPWNQLLSAFDVFAMDTYPEPWSGPAPFNGMGGPAPQIGFPNGKVRRLANFLEFPNAGRRRPLRCQFTYNDGANSLDLWVVHLPPYVGPAGNALEQLATSPDIIAPPNANVMRVICGDFNLNTQNAYQLGLFAPMTGLGYTLQIGGAGLLDADTTTVFKHPCSWDTYLNGLSLDNALTRAGAGTTVDAMSVVDVVAGEPAGVFATQLQTPLGAYPAMGGNPSQVFRAWANYGHIGNRPATGNMTGRRGASDHLPLLISF